MGRPKKVKEVKQEEAEVSAEEKTAQPQNKSTDDTMPMTGKPEEGDYIAELFGTGKPLDERTRNRTEKAWNEAITLLFAKQKRRLMKAARELKGV